MRLALLIQTALALSLLTSALPLRSQTGEPPAALAAGAADRAYFNQELSVSKGQVIHNATCVFCSVQVDGEVTGRVLVLFGNLNVSGRVDGRTMVVGGNAVFDGEARVQRSTTVLFGNLVYETEDVLMGSAYVLGGHSSSYAARERLHRRLAVSPKLVTTLVLLGLLLFLAGAYGVRQQRHSR